MQVSTALQRGSIPASCQSSPLHVNAFPTDQIQGIHYGGNDSQTNFEEKTNQSEKEKEKAVGRIEISADMRLGRRMRQRTSTS